MKEPYAVMCICSPSTPVTKKEAETGDTVRSSLASLEYTMKQKQKRDFASKTSWKAKSGSIAL